MSGAPSWNWVVAANILLGIKQGLAWSMTVTSKVDMRVFSNSPSSREHFSPQPSDYLISENSRTTTWIVVVWGSGAPEKPQDAQVG